MEEMDEYNRRLIEDFRAHGGKVSGDFERTPMLLLTSTGARSGQRHTTPMGYMPDDDRLIVFAANGGAPKNPDWYHNLVAQPHVTVEVGTETFAALAVATQGAEREQLWIRGVAMFPFLAKHQAKTPRQIPVIALSRLQG
jgi:deazaflavin-dependent oxidoreductase (nitroreductase family)